MTDLGFLHWGLSSAVKSPSTHPRQVSALTDRKANVKSEKILYAWSKSPTVNQSCTGVTDMEELFKGRKGMKK